MKGGVLIIGSLFWQDGSTKQPWDGVRKHWRDTYLDLEHKLAVRVPIRYGGYSALREIPVRVAPQPLSSQSLATNITAETSDATGTTRYYLVPDFEAGVYTMIFSMAYDTPALHGTAWLCPLRDDVADLPGVWKQVKALSQAEGIYFSDNSYFNKPWGAVTALLRPGLALENPMRAEWAAKTHWRDKHERRAWIDAHGSEQGYVPYAQQFKLGKEIPCLNSDGLLNVKELHTTDGRNVFDPTDSDLRYDFVLTSVTLPRLAPGADPGRYPTAAEIGRCAQVDTRRYFQHNHTHGIYTADDPGIWQRLGFSRPSPDAF